MILRLMVTTNSFAMPALHLYGTKHLVSQQMEMAYYSSHMYSRKALLKYNQV